MIGNRRQQAIYQSDFYRVHFHRTLNALMVSCVIILALIAAIAYFILFKPAPKYYATSLGGQLIPMTAIHPGKKGH